MNVESFSYAALTTLIGMGVVFLFLIVLSLLMVAIRVIFDSYRPLRRTGTNDRSSGGTSYRDEEIAAGGGALVTDASGIPRWVIAGALAYLIVEDEEYQPVAGSWTYSQPTGENR